MRLTILASLGAITLAVLSLANLVGASYARFAAERLDRPDSASTAAAARIAARWPPWSSSHAAMHAWVLAENRDSGAAAIYHRALRLAPADPFLWSEYALALARLGRFDSALAHATVRAQRLAPTSSAVQRTIADLGLSYWSRGTPEQQALWLVDMRRERDQDRAAFLAHVLTRGQGLTFCRDPARRLGEEQWCESIAETLLSPPA